MKKLLVGTPLLGEDSLKRKFKPLITVETRSGKSRYILLPSLNYITVLSLAGIRIAVLVPSQEDSDSAHIVSVCSRSRNNRSLVMVALSSGEIAEFDVDTFDKLATDALQSSDTFQEVDGFLVRANILCPSRFLSFAESPKLCNIVSSPDGSCIYAITIDERNAASGLIRFDPDASDSLSWETLHNIKYDNKACASPFAFCVSSSNATSNTIILGSTSSILFVQDDLQQNEGRQHHRIMPPKGRKYTSADVSSNGTDLAVGLDNGAIQVMNGVLKSVFRQKAVEGSHEKNGARKIFQKLHWHSHPLRAVKYLGGKATGNPVLYSGADESVLITWRPGEGSDKPAHTLPRIALGGILGIEGIELASETNMVLIYCSDDSLHLFETHNFSRKWKLEGIGYTPGTAIHVHNDSSRDNVVLLSGLDMRPGRIDWYDVSRQVCTYSLEAAIFNRVSRSDPGDETLPMPAIQHVTQSRDGKTLMTIDVISTEDYTVGTCGSVRTLRFWSSNESDTAYQAYSSMINPHGLNNAISGAALAPNGQVACTISKSENSFRLWSAQNEKRKWKCEYKVSTPFGLQISSVSSQVAFSNDSSVLAISYGNVITLWNHADAVLIKRLNHGDQKQNIRSLEFITAPSAYDCLLSSSEKFVSLQSLFAGSPIIGWTWELNESEVLVTSACASAHLDLVAISVRDGNVSYVILADVASGRLRGCEYFAHGIVKSVVFNEVLSSDQRLSPCNRASLTVVMESGAIVSLESKVGVVEGPRFANEELEVPTLSGAVNPNKRQKLHTAFVPRSLDRSSIIEFSDVELPMLRGGFVRSLVERNMTSA